MYYISSEKIKSKQMANKIFYLLVVGLIWMGSSYLTAQSSVYELDLANSSVAVTGGSTLHDWKAEAGSFGMKPEHISLSPESKIENLYFFVKVDSLDGGRGATMNKKIYKAFNSQTHPLIEFTQLSATTIQQKEGSENMEIIAQGKLKMAGVEKEVELQVMGEKEEDNIVLKGSKDMKMSDFEIETPSALFGQIVCDDDITVVFELAFKLVK